MIKYQFENNKFSITFVQTTIEDKMKRVISTFISIVVCTCLCAQDLLSEHVSFKGIPLDGSLSLFTQRMKDEGFYESSEEEQNYIKKFYGSFIEEPSTILVYYSPSMNVYRVDVVQIHMDSDDLPDAFADVKALYATKYGSPEVIQGVCFWEIPYGNIALILDRDNKSIRITYEDEKNSETAMEEKKRAKEVRNEKRLSDI